MKYPNRWKAQTYHGTEVVGYPVRRMVDVCEKYPDPPCYRTHTTYVWDMYVCDRNYNYMEVCGNGQAYYKSVAVPICSETLVEIVDDK